MKKNDGKRKQHKKLGKSTSMRKKWKTKTNQNEFKIIPTVVAPQKDPKRVFSLHIEKFSQRKDVERKFARLSVQ